MTWLKAFAKVTLYQPLYNLLIFFVWLVPDHNVGWAIILLTIVVRIAFYPLNASMIRSQQAIASLQPEIDRIKKEYKDDPQAQSKATMELYTAKKINPFGSCVLLLIQLPILWILYQVFTVGLDTSHFGLLYNFTPRPELVNTFFFGTDLIKPSIIIGVLAGIAQYFQSRQMMANQPKPAKGKDADPSAAIQSAISKQSMYMFPLLTIFISTRFPAALSLYWLTTTVAMVAQQWWMTRNVPKAKKDDVKVTIRKPGKK